MGNEPMLGPQPIFLDLIESEKALRQKAEATLRAQARLLFQVASAFAGKDFERVRKEDPEAVNYWSPQQWQAFFYQYILPQRHALTWGNESSPKAGGGASRKLDQENTSLRHQLEIGLKELQVKDREIEKLRSQLEALQSAFQLLGESLVMSNPKVEEGTSPVLEASVLVSNPGMVGFSEAVHLLPQALLRKIKPHQVSTDGVSPVGYAQILEDLKGWKRVSRPARFPKLLESGLSEERWQRQSMALYILASYGIGVRMELDWLISHAVGTKANSGAQRLTIDKLAELGLVVRRRLYESTPPMGSQLIVLVLSEDGRRLCDLFGWQVVESEWERILRLHCQGDPEQEKSQEAHTLNILSFIRNARYRGYRAMVVPQVPGKSSPDAYVDRAEEFSYVEVERSSKEKTSKWLHQAELQGQVALCALDPKSRLRLVSDCKLQGAIHHGRATDMRTLMELASIHKEDISETPLWAEEW
jgi:hypothetical protein